MNALTPKGRIVAVATAAAETASGWTMDGSAAAEIYSYGRKREWPPAETLARKYAELKGLDFPWPNLAKAPAPLEIAFTMFRATCVALEPLWPRLDECSVAEPSPPPVTEENAMTDPTKPADDVASRTKAGQEEMDAAIGASGGAFGDGREPPTPSRPAAEPPLPPEGVEETQAAPSVASTDAEQPMGAFEADQRQRKASTKKKHK